MLSAAGRGKFSPRIAQIAQIGSDCADAVREDGGGGCNGEIDTVFVIHKGMDRENSELIDGELTYKINGAALGLALQLRKQQWS